MYFDIYENTKISSKLNFFYAQKGLFCSIYEITIVSKIKFTLTEFEE